MQKTNPTRLVLASQSPVRARLLAQAGLQFSTRGAPVDERRLEAENAIFGAPASQLAEHLAKAKALSVSHSQANDLVIGADQVLACDETILHKPRSAQEAAKRLAELAGRTHCLHTAFALARNGQTIVTHVETATLTMRPFRAAEIATLIAHDPEGATTTPGAYRVETAAIQLFERIEGDYFAILGLPLLPLLAALRQHAPHLMLAAERATPLPEI